MSDAHSNRRSFLTGSLAAGALLGLRLPHAQALGAVAAAGEIGDFKLSLAE